jgi:hypothetical protein
MTICCVESRKRVTRRVASKDELERDLAIAFKSVSGSASKSAQGSENRYGAAYQNLVKAGFRPQIRRKYRAKG